MWIQIYIKRYIILIDHYYINNWIAPCSHQINILQVLILRGITLFCAHPSFFQGARCDFQTLQISLLLWLKLNIVQINEVLNIYKVAVSNNSLYTHSYKKNQCIIHDLFLNRSSTIHCMYTVHVHNLYYRRGSRRCVCCKRVLNYRGLIGYLNIGV
jgi:hypothetical protein